ncbi:hypothetical protein [Halovivax sp.]|uniref:hypothetical protein n=1 Tax=Halovivax sp. TaxID=1935978 RepID=UPI0025C0F1CA|nr:hypothetical protein [Halovivax sp.]
MVVSTDETFIVTYSGRRVDPFDVSPTDVHLRDVAAGLSHTCRFGGHCKHFYSVAHHSLNVSRELPREEPRLQLIGLLHDAGEAYLGDIPRPLKARLERIQPAEDRILESVWEALAIEPPTTAEWERVMAADDRLLAYEANELLEDASWADAPPDVGYDLGPEPSATIRERFRSRAKSLLVEATADAP